MYKEIHVDFCGKKTSILVDWNNETEHDRVPCFIVGLSSHYHDKFSPEFRSHYQLILLDLYWTDNSYSQGYIDKLSLTDMIDHIEKVREALEEKLGSRYQKIVVAGHSAYGLLCLEYALRYKSQLYGIINLGSPPHFNEARLQQIQERYLDANFGPDVPNGSNQRRTDYYHYKNTFEKRYTHQKSSVMLKKEQFVQWYLSMGPILWKERKLWQNQNGIATKIWEPWSIPLLGSNDGTQRDINMVVINHYFKLAKGVNYEETLQDLAVPTLWIIGLFDIRVSTYLFEDIKLKNKLIEFYTVETGHWPMYEDGHTKFDHKAIQWLDKIKTQEVIT